ncbi:hypothetical protein [Paenibacillus arenilitoris]|uniref:Uncharacterized protein n=1 Tax=Paenibacillus arenilitoris TaxID=2772299 RepID=A0A927CIN1_9BACL|nr:hypothetical protein [Paenibacillus arenilitoris]MBD2868209.1 hypothetical protein [Paenibacillus arenilitoris]
MPKGWRDLRSFSRRRALIDDSEAAQPIRITPHLSTNINEIELFYWRCEGDEGPMEFIFFLLVNVGITIVFFTIRRKRLHPVEIFLYWCLSSLIFQNYSAIQTMNIKSSIVPDEWSPAFAHLLNRIMLYPVISLLFLNGYCAIKSRGTKVIYFLGWAAAATSVEWLSSIMGVFVHVWLKIGWSAAFWLFHNGALIGVMYMTRLALFRRRM